MRSNGRAGEEAARIWFACHGWYMTKTEPAVKNLGPVFGKAGQFRAVYTASGTPDFLGYALVDRCGHGATIPYFRAVEVKEAHGDSWPASKLTLAQRTFMATLPAGCAHVYILWDDGGAGEMYPFTARGSYKRGQGVK